MKSINTSYSLVIMAVITMLYTSSVLSLDSHPQVMQTSTDTLPSCLNGTNVTNDVTYLCGLVCDSYYYSHMTTLPPDYECTVNHDVYGQFKTWYMCGDIITAKYSFYKEDSWGACNFV